MAESDLRGLRPIGFPVRWTTWTAVCAAAVLAGCASAPRDGPPRNPPPGLAQTPDAEPRVEPIRGVGGTSRPYAVAGRSYTPITDDRPLVERGLASWYGQGFHARSTATGEPYDMYAMTAAHRTMPLPSYARVRNPANGREVIVRVNDRGPFRDDRIIDLSYTAALRLDLLRGVAPVEVERLTNEAIRTGAWRRSSDTQLAASAPTSFKTSEAVPVSAAWVQPVVAGPASAPAPVVAPAPAPTPVWRLAQAATPIASDAGSAPATSDAAVAAPALPAEPPPRFRNMEVAPLAPMTPPPSVAPAPAAVPLPGTSSPTAAPPSATAAAAGAATGIWMQLGAFREREGAQALLARVAASQPDVASRLRIVEEAGAHKVQLGPYASRDAAQTAAAPLRSALGLAPFTVERR